MRNVTILGTLKAQAKRNVADSLAAYTRALEVQQRVVKMRNSQLSFKVTIASLWPDHGGKDAEVAVKGSLEKAMQQAITRFQELNGCSDVQGSYTVLVVLSGKVQTTMVLPESHWKHLTWKASRSGQ